MVGVHEICDYAVCDAVPLHLRGGGKVGAINVGQGDGRRARQSRRRPDGRQKWSRRNCYVVILKDPRAAAAGGSAHDPRSPPRIQGEHDDPRESRNRRPDGIGAQACVGSTEYADICGYISSGNSVIEQDVVHRTFGRAFAPVPLMSCQVVPPSVVRKTWPSVSPKPEKAEYVAYATFGSCVSTARAVTVRPDGRAGVVRSVQFEPVPASALVVFEIRLPEALPAVVPT